MHQKHLLLINPRSGNVTPEKIDMFRSIFSSGKEKLDTSIVVTENLSHLEQVVTEYKRREITIVGIVGGDGTVMRARTFVENIWGYQPSYAFFPLGTMNNVQRAVGLTTADSSFKLAKQMADTACIDTLERYTVSMPSLDINGKKGFNIGFGIIPRLLWMYYGNSAKHYLELEEALQSCSKEEYQTKYEEITGKKEADFFDLLSEERGLWGAAKAALRLLNGLRPHTDEAYLLHKALAGEIRFDGEKKIFPEVPLGAYISSYEEINLGLGSFNPKPAPGARKEEGKFQVVVPYGNPFSIILQLPRVAAGKRLSNATYDYISTLELPAEKLAEVDGEPLPEKGFILRYDGKRKVITLPVTV